MNDEIMVRAEDVHVAIVHELRMADHLSHHGLYTEAALRLGRATEATLYAVARELCVPLRRQTIKQLSSLKQQIDGSITDIMRKQDVSEVRRLSTIVKSLADAISDLSADKELTKGQEVEDDIRPTEQILRDLKALVDDSAVKAQLGKNESLLRTVQVNRNRAAHASTDGSPREFTADEYLAYSASAESLLVALLNIALANRAKRTLGPTRAQQQQDHF